MTPVGKIKKRVGIALSGGAARGIAHVGVLDILHKAGIPIDIVAGTSAGSVAGAVYASLLDTNKMLGYALDPVWKKVINYSDPTLGKTGFLKGQKAKKILERFLGGEPDFKDLKIPFACVATDIDTGEEIILKEGSVIDAVRASISIPGIFTVVEREKRYLVDGGLTTPLPVHVARELGADFVIAVNVNPSVSMQALKKDENLSAQHKEPNLLHILMQSIYITTYSLAHASMAEADVVIQPNVGHISAADFKRADEFVRLGWEAAEKVLPEIKKKLAEL
jgi:NTE family protein